MIMGRGTDIKVAETDMERGLVVIQIDSRPNSRVERQFAGVRLVKVSLGVIIVC